MQLLVRGCMYANTVTARVFTALLTGEACLASSISCYHFHCSFSRISRLLRASWASLPSVLLCSCQCCSVGRRLRAGRNTYQNLFPLKKYSNFIYPPLQDFNFFTPSFINLNTKQIILLGQQKKYAERAQSSSLTRANPWRVSALSHVQVSKQMLMEMMWPTGTYKYPDVDSHDNKVHTH